MTLAPGRMLGPYRIEGSLAAGGMGEVYSAIDTRLDRPVAIKTISRSRVDDPAAVERFEREARALAALGHPHICALFDVGRDGDLSYIVMELIEGETLSKRLASDARLPVDEALRCAIDIADALEKAHRHGVVHRDLKPSNVMLTKSGVKLLDFGVAKVLRAPDGEEADTAMPGDAPSALTEPGLVVGTLPYMAPEQIKGREPDGRADIFAFGALLYEMLTGRRAFQGSARSRLVSAILDEDPEPPSSLEPAVPEALDRVVSQCFAKDPDDRWQSAGDLKRELAWIAEGGHETGFSKRLLAGRRQRRRWPVFVAAGSSFTLLVVLVAVVVLGSRAFRAGAPPMAPLHLQLSSAGLPLQGAMALSPDGRYLAYPAPGPDRQMRLHVRPLGSSVIKVLDATEGAQAPFWSPDSKLIGFASSGKLKKVAVEGGVARDVCPIDGVFLGGTWNGEGTVVFSVSPGGLYRVPAQGGAATPLFSGGSSARASVLARPTFLPDGRRLMFLDATRQTGEKPLYLSTLDSGERTVLTQASSAAVYSQGHLLFVRRGVLVAQEFDLARAALVGEPMSIANDVWCFREGVAGFSASESGILVYANATGSRSQLAWFDRSGKKLGAVGDPGVLGNFDVSADGERVLYAALDPQKEAFGIHLLDLARGVTSAVAALAEADLNDPNWGPGDSVAFTVRGARPAILRQPVNGGPSTVLYEQAGTWPVLEDWSADGRWLALHRGGDLPGAGQRAAVFDTVEKKLWPLEHQAEAVDEIHVSPDGKWIAYGAREAAHWEVYVARLPPTQEHWQISVGGGKQPVWRNDGAELYYLIDDGSLMAVEVRANAGALKAGRPTCLFDTGLKPAPIIVQYATTDGRRFLLKEEPRPASGPWPPPLEVVVNWPAALKQGR